MQVYESVHVGGFVVDASCVFSHLYLTSTINQGLVCVHPPTYEYLHKHSRHKCTRIIIICEIINSETADRQEELWLFRIIPADVKETDFVLNPTMCGDLEHLEPINNCL